MKKAISLGLISVLVLSMLLLFASCGAKSSEGLEYKSNGDGTCAVIGMGTCTDTELVIPKKSPDGDKVTSISDEAFKNAKITLLKIVGDVTEIGRNAFMNCNHLKTVALGKSLIKLGSEAFFGCDLITEIELPETFEEFGKKVDYKENEYGCSGTFEGCVKLSTINIPKNVKAIYSDTFKGTALSNVKMDVQFKYGIVDFIFSRGENIKEEIKKPELYRPSLLSEMPVDDSISGLEPVRAVETSEQILNLLYAALFGENALINGDPILVPAPRTTVGDYGRENADKNSFVYSITSNSEIRQLHWDEKTRKYTTYDIDSLVGKDIYTYSFDEKVNCYVYNNAYGRKEGFLVLDKYLFISEYSGHFELNKGYNK